MKRVLCVWALGAAALLLAACGERPQTNAHGVRVDSPPWSGTGAKPNTGTAFTAPGWEPGNRDSWEAQLKVRNQRQNEYLRIN
ncbi:MAG: hypothetical protein J7549_02225 [Variovorax sp.]|nr:hypothetical protein [Variovorax sp.]